MAVILAASITLAVGGEPAAVASPSRWRYGQSPLPAEIDGINAVSCGSPASCLAIGVTAGANVVLLRSDDGGLRWTEGPDPGLGFLAVSCVTALRCMATTGPYGVGTSPNGVATSTDGGLTWRADRSVPRIRGGYWGVVRCPTASVCYVFNSEARSYLTGGIERTTDFGRHWTTEHVSGGQAITSVLDASCATPADCVAVAQWSRGGKLSPVLQTSDGGRTWLVRVAPIPDLGTVSCGSSLDCIAAGGSGAGADAVASADGGVTWRATARLRAVGTAWDVTCTAARSCLLVGQTGDGLANNGVVARTTDLGQHWTVTRTARGAGFLPVVSCPSAAHCVAGRESNGDTAPSDAGSQGFEVSDNGGASWRQVGLPLAIAELQSVACPAASVCFAAGGTSGPVDDAIVVRSRDGGRTWRVVLVTGRLQALSGISCGAVRECLAVGTLNYGTGNGIARTDDGGRRWRVSRPPAGVAEVDSVTCPTAAFCEALGRTANGGPRLLRSTDGGRRWHVARAPRGVANLLGLSCATRRVCTAVGDGVYPPGPAIIERTTDGGLKWTSQRPPRGATILDSVSCPGTRTCYAFSDTEPATIDATHDGGARWTVQPISGPGLAPDSSLSCATSRICTGVATNDEFSGVVFGTANGESWREEVLPRDAEWLLGISCHRQGCVVVGLDGQILAHS